MVPDRGPVGGGIAVAAAFYAIPIALAASQARARLAGRPSRPLREDAFVLGFLALGVALPHVGIAREIEYLAVRPLLFAYGLLNYQLLDVDLRERQGTLLAAVVPSMVALFVVLHRALATLGIDAAVAAGVAAIGTVTVGGGLAAPLVRIVLATPTPADDARNRDVYRAALEAVVTQGGDASRDHALRVLRDRLRISEREHAVIEAAARGDGGGPAGVAGERFLGRYRVLRVLGEAGFARALLAEDEQVGRRVVLKVARAAGPEEGARMRREARLAGALRHPNIVTVYDVEQVGTDVVLVLEHVEGGSLAGRLARGPMGERDAVKLVREILSALGAAHAAGVVHGDVKPANVLLDRDGAARLGDFGVARVVEAADTAGGFSLAGAAPGSLRYMAPEQVRGLPPGPRSDLYALGAVLYEALAGRPYLDFTGRVDFEVRLAILDERPALPLPGVSAAVNALLDRLLAKDPAMRPASAAEAARMLPGVSAGVAER